MTDHDRHAEKQHGQSVLQTNSTGLHIVHVRQRRISSCRTSRLSQIATWVPNQHFRRREPTFICCVVACACLQCTLDFDRFAPVAAGSSDSGGAGNAVGNGAAGSDLADSSIGHDDTSKQPTDASIQSSDADQGVSDARAGDAALEAACAPKQSCLNEATTCVSACTTSYDACIVACNDRQPCKITCEKTQTSCKRPCETTCEACATDAGCQSATSCQMAAQ
jgi:hypothetical protein